MEGNFVGEGGERQCDHHEDITRALHGHEYHATNTNARTTYMSLQWSSSEPGLAAIARAKRALGVRSRVGPGGVASAKKKKKHTGRSRHASEAATATATASPVAVEVRFGR